MSLLELDELVVRLGRNFRIGPVSFAMGPGVLHVEGRNGCGKTTLMRAMCGELVPSQGRVLVAGRDVHKHTETRRRIAFVSALPELPDFLSVREAWQFTASLRRAHDWDGDAYCAGLNLDPALPLAAASAGQRQKAELVCALAGDPDVLLLDEVFTHLDQESSALLRSWIREWASSRLIVFTHHGAAPIQASATLNLDGERIRFEANR